MINFSSDPQPPNGGLIVVLREKYH